MRRLARDNGAEKAALVLGQAEKIAEAHGSEVITAGMVETAIRWLGKIIKGE